MENIIMWKEDKMYDTIRDIVSRWDHDLLLRCGWYDRILVKCWSKEEAFEIKRRVREIRPDIKLVVSWIEFSEK